MSKRTREPRSAFTLIELLIVIAIVLILIAIALPNLTAAQIRALVARTEGDLKGLETALETYKLDWKAYPYSFQIHVLTTPSQFVPRLPEDPFAPILDTDKGHKYLLRDYGSPLKRYYIYTVPEMRTDRWCMTGLGPDSGWYDVVESPSNCRKTRFYCPTNGLRSTGNVDRPGPRRY